MSEVRQVFALVVEGISDARTIPQIVDRVLIERMSTQAEALEGVRVFRGLEPGSSFLAWDNVEHASRQRRVPPWHGHFNGEPAVEDARRAVLALRCFMTEDSQPAAVLLIRDSDGKKEEREEGLKQARDHFKGNGPFEVLFGVAHANRECWVLSAFMPQNKQENSALSALRKELGFDPTRRSEALTATGKTAKKSAKRVLERLTDNDDDREERGWRDADLDHLRKVGLENGLAAFLDEIDQKLVPLVATPPSP